MKPKEEQRQKIKFVIFYVSCGDQFGSLKCWRTNYLKC